MVSKPLLGGGCRSASYPPEPEPKTRLIQSGTERGPGDGRSGAGLGRALGFSLPPSRMTLSPSRQLDIRGSSISTRCAARLAHFDLQRAQLLQRIRAAVPRGLGQRVGAMLVLRRCLPGMGLAGAARHVLAAIEVGRAQLAIGPAVQVLQVLDGAAGVAMHEEAPLRAAAALAYLAVATEALARDGKAYGEVVAIAQAHADGAEGATRSRAVVVVIVVESPWPPLLRARPARGIARRRAEVGAGRQPKRARRLARPSVLQGHHRRLLDGRRRGRLAFGLRGQRTPVDRAPQHRRRGWHRPRAVRRGRPRTHRRLR